MIAHSKEICVKDIDELLETLKTLKERSKKLKECL